MGPRQTAVNILRCSTGSRSTTEAEGARGVPGRSHLATTFPSLRLPVAQHST